MEIEWKCVMNEYFIKELYYIKNERIRDSANTLVNLLPDYFYHIPASSTGKYHPKYALGDGGLLRHTKVVVRLGYELLNNNSIGYSFTSDEKDLLLLGMMLHDGLKSGKIQEKYTRYDHPTLACNFVLEHKDKTKLTDAEVNLLTNAMESHMGEWNKDYNGNEILPKPSNKYQRMVHMCDFLASKKFLEVEFDKINNIIN